MKRSNGGKTKECRINRQAEFFCAEKPAPSGAPHKARQSLSPPVVSPGTVLKDTEEIGFITAVDEWVLKTACAQFKEWHNAGLPDLFVAVNLSAKQLQKSDFVERTAGILRETGFDPHHLEVEITESVAMRNLEQTIPNMILLTEMGVGISVDNFGTGYSSLNYLKNCPSISLRSINRFFRISLPTLTTGRLSARQPLWPRT